MQHVGKLICSNLGARMDSEPKQWRILGLHHSLATCFCSCLHSVNHKTLFHFYFQLTCSTILVLVWNSFLLYAPICFLNWLVLGTSLRYIYPLFFFFFNYKGESVLALMHNALNLFVQIQRGLN